MVPGKGRVLGHRSAHSERQRSGKGSDSRSRNSPYLVLNQEVLACPDSRCWLRFVMAAT